MPVVKALEPKVPDPLPANFELAVGHSDDFYVLGHSPELDDAEQDKNPEHEEFTFVFRFQARVRSTVGRLSVRLEDLWQPPRGPILAVGSPKGIIQIDANGLTEVAVPRPSIATSIWGTNEDHVFVTGGPYDPYVIYRRYGQWSALPLPAGATPTIGVCGLNENEVYFVGNHGQIHLWDGQRISRLPSPTTRHLSRIVRLNDKYMCIGGHDGTLLMGNRQGWRIVPSNTTEQLTIASLDDKVYFGAAGVTWSFDGASAPVKAIDAPVHVLSGLADGLLLSQPPAATLYAGGKLFELDTAIAVSDQ